MTDASKTNAGKARSQSRIVCALFSLMRNKKFDDITVTELCDTAGVVRKTFYRNFESKTAVVKFEFDKMFEGLSQRFDAENTRSRDMLAYCFEFIAAERGFGAAFTDRGLHDTVNKKIRECVETFFTNSLHNAVAFDPMLGDFYTTFIADGILSVFRTWINGGCKQSPSTMAVLSVRLLGVVIT